ncbi:hypothetical protein F4861DRAFT_507269 [Xylaria intraflava]|nr:hypothetical protein F4861DRAFT_507269 [Xylaria intraflava]
MARIGIAVKALIVFYKSPLGGERSASEISQITGVSKAYINRLYVKVRERGFDPTRFPIIFDDAWLEEAPRSGRPTKLTEETKQFIIAKLEEDKDNNNGRERTCASLAGELRSRGTEISASTVRRMLREADHKKPKSTHKKVGRPRSVKHDGADKSHAQGPRGADHGSSRVTVGDNNQAQGLGTTDHSNIHLLAEYNNQTQDSRNISHGGAHFTAENNNQSQGLRSMDHDNAHLTPEDRNQSHDFRTMDHSSDHFIAEAIRATENIRARETHIGEEHHYI